MADSINWPPYQSKFEGAKNFAKKVAQKVANTATEAASTGMATQAAKKLEAERKRREEMLQGGGD